MTTAQLVAEDDHLKTKNAELRRALLKAFTVVEWVVGEGYVLPQPHYDADDLLLELVHILGVEDSNEARTAIAKATQPED